MQNFLGITTLTDGCIAKSTLNYLIKNLYCLINFLSVPLHLEMFLI